MDTLKMYARDRRDIAVVFTATLIAMISSKGLALVPGLALDDYGALHEGRDPLFYFGQGRFVQAAIQIVLSSLGLPSTSISWPSTVLFFGFAAWAITLGVLHVAKGRGQAAGLAAVGAVMASHPYLTEYFTFRESLITQGTSFLLLAAVLHVAQIPLPDSRSMRMGKRFSVLLLMVLLAGAQQTAFIVLGFFLMAAWLQQFLVRDDAGERRADDGSAGLLALYLVAGVVYFITAVIFQKMSGAYLDSRNSVVGADQLGSRMEAILALSSKVLLHKEPVLSLGVKIYASSIFLFFLAIAALRRPLNLVLIPMAALVFYLGSIVLVSVSGGWWPVPRAIYGVGFALGVSLLLVYLNCRGFWSRLFPGLTFIIAFGFSLHSSAMLYDQIRLNRWDAWVAESIAGEVVRAGVGSESRIVIVGAPWVHPLGPARVDGNLNVSALAVPWAANDLFEEATGRRWQVESIADDAECKGVNPWPAAGAIKRVADAFYVCLGAQ